MKKKSVLMALMLAFVLAMSLCACGSKDQGGSDSKQEETAEPAAEAQTAETAPAETTAETPPAGTAETAPAETPAETAPAEEPAQEEIVYVPEGEYKLIAIEGEGMLVDPTAMLEEESILTLHEDGSGYMSLEGEGMEFAWTLEGDKMTLTAADGSVLEVTWDKGVIKMGFGDYSMYYAKEDADLTGLEILSPEDALQNLEGQDNSGKTTGSLLNAFWYTMDPAAGIHLNYEYVVSSMGATTQINAYGKGGSYYSSRTVQVSGFEQETVTALIDGKVYNLYPSDKTGNYIMDVPSIKGITENGMLIDTLYQAVWFRAFEEDYTEETREIDGTSYRAEVYPVGSLGHTDTFLFDDQGQLVQYIQGASENSALNLGEIVYNVNAVDDQVDEAVFSIEGFDIAE